MFNEQLAVLLLIMANQMPHHATAPNLAAQKPVVTQQSNLRLKIDPKLAAASSHIQRVSQRRTIQPATLVASN